MRPFSSWGVTLAPAEMLTTFTSRPARRKSPSRCATYTPADEAVGTAAMTRWAISGPGGDAFIAAGPGDPRAPPRHPRPRQLRHGRNNQLPTRVPVRPGTKSGRIFSLKIALEAALQFQSLVLLMWPILMKGFYVVSVTGRCGRVLGREFGTAAGSGQAARGKRATSERAAGSGQAVRCGGCGRSGRVPSGARSTAGAGRSRVGMGSAGVG